LPLVQICVKSESFITLSLNKVSGRPQEITVRYLVELDKHIDDLRFGRAERSFEAQDLAEKLHVYPTHLSNTLHQVLGQSPCDLYESRLLALAKDL